MAYADPVDAATPADTDISGQGDDKIREFKRGIRQRLASFFQNVDNDPLVPIPGLIPVDTFLDDTFPGAKLVADSIPTAKLLHTDTIPADMVIAASIKNLEVTTPKLADDAVTTPKIADHAVTRLQLADDAVETSVIKDKQVTAAKIADHTITALQLDPAVAAGRVTQLNGNYVFAGSTVIAGAGTDYLQIDIASVDIAALPLNSPAIATPDLSGLNPAAGEWPDGLVFHACVIGILGARSLRVRIKNTNTFDVDVSAKSFYWQINQAIA